MLKRNLSVESVKIFKRRLFQMYSSKYEFNVCIIGSGSNIGQVLGLLLMLNPMVRLLNLYDTSEHADPSSDLVYIRSKVKVKSFETRKQAMEGADVIVVTAGEQRKKGMLREDLFGSNVGIIKETTLDMAEVVPKAMLAIVTDPINLLVPVACELLQRRNKLDPNRIFGVTTIDTMRAIQLYAQLKRLDPANVEVPVIGGHSAKTIVPLISRADRYVNLPQKDIETLTKNIQDAGAKLVEKRRGLVTPLTMAYAVYKFISSLLKGMDGHLNIIETAYVKSDVTSVPYFSNPLVLGEFGVEENLGIGHINDYEKRLLDICIEDLKKNIQKAMDYVEKNDKIVKK